jgi:alpha/beta superfamily hydrolase
MSTTSTLSVDDLQSKEEHKEKALLILAGYSYGSLIAKHLPPTSQILEHFSLTTAGSAAAEILLRAHTLSAQSNRDLEDSGQSKTHSSHEHSLTVKMGGEETSPEIRRSSREIRRSSERARSLDLQHSIRSISLRRRRRDDNSLSIIESRVERPESASPAVEANTYPAVSTAYLLISTVPAPLSTLMIPAVEHKIWNRHKDYHADNIVQRPTLALFGDQDGFVAVRKYRHWAARLKAELGSRFEYQEVTGAGHFWHEEGAELHLRNAIQKWVQGL